jgi:nucleoside-diphosphate-sugar epimerase
VRAAGILLGIRAVAICPTTIYGAGRGLKKDSDQIPKLVSKARRAALASTLGKDSIAGRTCLSTTLIDLYLLALEKAPSASFFFAENGEEQYKRIAESISRSLGFGGKAESWPIAEAIAELGEQVRSSLASPPRAEAMPHCSRAKPSSAL